METHLHHHTEHHLTSSAVLTDIVIGMADGLTVPFALAAGLSGAGIGTHTVITAGFAEIIAGSIAMGLGGYLAARSEAELAQKQVVLVENEFGRGHLLLEDEPV